MAELIEILDEDGQKTGEILSIDEVHRKELMHGVAHVWAYNRKGQMLMHQRHPDLSWGAGQWDLAGGGHISAEEDPKIAALRELKEEMGISVDEDQLELVGITISINTTTTTGKTHRVYEWNYIVELDIDLSEVKLQEDEAIKADWLDLDKLEADIRDEIEYKKYAPRNPSLYELVITKIRETLGS